MRATSLWRTTSYKAFQRGRFGKAIGRHAPAALYAQLTNKAESAGLWVEVVSPREAQAHAAQSADGHVCQARTLGAPRTIGQR